MVEEKCLINSPDGCIMKDETAIVLVVSTLVAVTLALPVISLLSAFSGSLPKR